MTDDFYVIFGDFFGWDWGTPAILQQNPNKSILVKIGSKLEIGRPPPPPPRHNLRRPKLKKIDVYFAF